MLQEKKDDFKKFVSISEFKIMRSQLKDLKNSVEALVSKQGVPWTDPKVNRENDMKEENLLLRKENQSLRIRLRQKELVV